jgi:hypothetical protein
MASSILWVVVELDHLLYAEAADYASLWLDIHYQDMAFQ